MASRRIPPGDDRQVSFSWIDPSEVMASADRRGGAVVFEAPEASRLVRGRAPKLPRVRAAKPRLASMGLPFAAREDDGLASCWSCGKELADEVVRVGPGMVACPGCGARIPFGE